MIDLEIIAYQLQHDEFACINVTLNLRRGDHGAKRWAISEMGYVLNKKGRWEMEPIPSSRTDAFYRRCRFDTAEEALAFWRKGKHTSRFAIQEQRT